MLDIQILSYKELTKEEREGVSNNGHGKEYASYIKVIHDGKTIALESDAMEPEDAIFHRDLSWVMALLSRCYQLGAQDAGGIDEYDPKTGQHL